MKAVTAYAPINIALIKYWGKKDPVNVLPYTDSISLSLDIYGTTTTLSYDENPGFSFSIDGRDDPLIGNKVRTHIRNMTGAQPGHLSVVTNNSGPTAAGLASSASGYAALTLAVDRYYGLGLSFDELQVHARTGSGSAVRSLLGGCVMWKREGTIASVPFPFDDVIMAFMVVTKKDKTIGSTAAMKLSVETSPLFHDWVHQSLSDRDVFLDALAKNDFQKIGRIAEANAQGMHRVCETSDPPVRYLNDISRRLIQGVRDARDLGMEVYWTADAGPNIKVMMRKKDKERFITHMKTITDINPVFSGIVSEGARIIHDVVHTR
jgi:diphosphomevalonate decarboxylase